MRSGELFELLHCPGGCIVRNELIPKLKRMGEIEDSIKLGMISGMQFANYDEATATQLKRTSRALLDSIVSCGLSHHFRLVMKGRVIAAYESGVAA